jgi:hypothetical protein
VGVRPNRPVRPERNWRRYLGPPNSRRRVVWTGIVGGVALALVAALIATAVGGSGFGSLNKTQPTAAAPVSNSSDGADQSQPPTVEPATDTPVEAPTDVATDTPVDEAPVDTPTEVPVVPTDTPVDEAPTDVPPAGTQ